MLNERSQIFKKVNTDYMKLKKDQPIIGHFKYKKKLTALISLVTHGPVYAYYN